MNLGLKELQYKDCFKLKGILMLTSIGLISGMLSACRFFPKPFAPDQFYQKAQHDIQVMFANQVPTCGNLDFLEAMARGLHYNLDNRIKQVDAAIKLGETHVAEFAMLPVLGGNASYDFRNNINATFASGPDLKPDKNIIAIGADERIFAWQAGIKWNLFDLGMGYIKTREKAELLLIAEEEARQQLQKLVQDIRVAYWSAYSAQQMCPELQELHCELQRTNHDLTKALADKIVPKQDLLNYQTILLEEQRKLVQLEDKLKKSELILRFLINLPSDQPLTLKAPPCSLTKIQDLRCLDFEKLDAITLAKRPELRSQGYRRRIAKLGTKTAILQALPVLNYTQNRNFNSNSFLFNNYWNEGFIESSWNVFNLASLPVSLKLVEAQTKSETLKLMALTLGALNETRIAYAHYQNLARECRIAKKQTQNATQLYRYLHHREQASLASRQQVILAKLQMLFARMDEVLLMADLSSALGQLYLASGFDVLPIEVTHGAPEQVLCKISDNLLMLERLGFKGYLNLTYDELFVKCCDMENGCEIK